jgi:hypothetical protein
MSEDKVNAGAVTSAANSRNQLRAYSCISEHLEMLFSGQRR